MSDIRNDIEKYLRGELTPAEMHELEKQALHDPFLADALEGADSIERNSFTADLHSLEKSLATRLSKKGGTSFSFSWPLRIAAGLVLLLASTYLIFNLTEKNNTEPSKLANKGSAESVQPDNPPAADSTRSNENFLSLKDEKDKSLPAAKPPLSQAAKPSDVQGEEDKVKTETPAVELQLAEEPALVTRSDEEELAVEIVEPEKTDEKITTPEPIAETSQAREKTKDLVTDDAARKESRVAGASAPTTAPVRNSKIRTVQGRVTDADDGSPLPGVNVVVKGTSKGTVTDVEGNYQIAVPESGDNLVFSFIGLESQEVPVQNVENVDVQMSPDVSQLSEVVVVGYGTEGFVEPENYYTFQLAEPDGGRRAYKKYLEQSVTYPERAIENKVEGKVTIQFTIEPTGQLTDFHVVRGIGYGCDEEVIRIIKQGPKWTPTKRSEQPIRGKVKVRMKFQLPEKK